MAAMSKRAQARTERELQGLLAVPGNSVCADCSARNPSWASWNLGIFLCMRCASIHRKLGTHISKVKSLSMDTWTNEQVENMRTRGNTAVNKVYNPTNKKPDMPFDADEVDNAMERFIRKKYQEKSLSDGRPEVPMRDSPDARTKSPDASPKPNQPRKHKFFGFGLRASSSAYPLSKKDKKNRDEPRVDSAFRITSEDYTSSTRTNSSRADMSDHELQAKLAQLRDMGFGDTERNTNILKRANGDVERTIAFLVKMPKNEPAKKLLEPSTPALDSASGGRIAASTKSNNPFDQLTQTSQTRQDTGFGISLANPAQQQATANNNNPWNAYAPSQQASGLEQSFTGMQISPARPLFPHSTGGYASQPLQDPRFNNASPPLPSLSNANPFGQPPLSAHSTGSNPYAAFMQGAPSFAPAQLNNNFTSAHIATQNPIQASAPQTQASSLQNPFGLPPQQSSQPTTPHSSNPFDIPQSSIQPLQHSQTFPVFQQMPQQRPNQPDSHLASHHNFSQFQGLQPQYTQQQAAPVSQSQAATYGFPQQQQANLVPQQTGRYDKAGILALYNYPQMALASIPEPVDGQPQQAPTQMADIPNQTGYTASQPSWTNPRRSSTMPLPTSNNPFMTISKALPATPSFVAQQSSNPWQTAVGARHTSQESVSVNNPNLLDGRHSPDAFASLSSRHL